MPTQINEIKETITWIGRGIALLFITSIWNMMQQDHDKNLTQDGLIANHEQRINILENRRKEVAVMAAHLEAILPESLKVENKEEEEK